MVVRIDAFFIIMARSVCVVCISCKVVTAYLYTHITCYHIYILRVLCIFRFMFRKIVVHITYLTIKSSVQLPILIHACNSTPNESFQIHIYEYIYIYAHAKYGHWLTYKNIYIYMHACIYLDRVLTCMGMQRGQA